MTDKRKPNKNVKQPTLLTSKEGKRINEKLRKIAYLLGENAAIMMSKEMKK